MDNQELTKLRQQLYEKNINMVALAEEYGCRASFVSQFFAGKGDQVWRVRVGQGLGAIDQLAGALGDKNGQGVAIFRFGEQFFHRWFDEHVKFLLISEPGVSVAEDKGFQAFESFVAAVFGIHDRQDAVDGSGEFIVDDHIVEQVCFVDFDPALEQALLNN